MVQDCYPLWGGECDVALQTRPPPLIPFKNVEVTAGGGAVVQTLRKSTMI